MVTLEKFKETIGDLGKQMSDEELLKLMELQANLARAIFDMWAEKVKTGIPSPLNLSGTKLVK